MQSFAETLLFFITTPMYVIFIGLEIFISNTRHKGWYTLRGTIENLWLMLANLVIDILMRMVALYVLTQLYESRFFEWENVLLYWITVMILQDLAFYTMHYVDHYCRLFWAVHVTHHSSEEFNLTVGLRSSLFEPLYRFVYFIPLVLIGLKPLDIFFAFSVTQLYGIFIHTQSVKKLGIIDMIFATPSNHRVHHGSNVKYLDRNMGMFLIIWDKLFGTYQKEEEEVKYGLTKNLESHDAWTVIFHEFKSMINDVKNAPTFKAKFMYIFGPPGWSHDGSRKTSRQMQKEIKSGNKN